MVAESPNDQLLLVLDNIVKRLYSSPEYYKRKIGLYLQPKKTGSDKSKEALI